MRYLVQSFPGQLRRGPVAALAFLLLAGVTAYKTSMYLVNDDFVGLAYVGIAYVIGAVVVTILRDWRNGLYFFSLMFVGYALITSESDLRKGLPWFPVAFIVFWYALLLLIPLMYQGLQAYQDFILNAYLWLLLGVLFRLPKLALEAQFAAPATLQPGRPWIC
jgi:hypothetical protein